MQVTSLHILVALIIFLFSDILYASWTVEENVDAMTDEIQKSAIVRNKQGHSFKVYRLAENGKVWGTFRLSEKSTDVLSANRPPVYRVDKNEPHYLEEKIELEKRMRRLGVPIKAYSQEPKWVNFLLWHGKEGEGFCKNLAELFQGNKLIFRYWLFTGGYKDTVFSLSGSRNAILQAIGASEGLECEQMARR